MKYLIILLLGITFCGCGNKQKDLCETIVCDFAKKGQVCDAGECKCPPDAYNFGTWCLPKKNFVRGSHLFYGTSPWGCMDTVVVAISEDPRTQGLFGNGGIAIYTPNGLWQQAEFSTDISKYEIKADGDTFSVLGFRFFTCPLFDSPSNKRVFPIISGKLNPAKDTLRLKVLWSTGTERPPLDSNTVVLVR